MHYGACYCFVPGLAIRRARRAVLHPAKVSCDSIRGSSQFQNIRPFMTPQSANITTNFRSLARFNFIAGLPRSGVSVLVALLRQNPRFRVGLNSPAEEMFSRTLARLTEGGEDADLLDDAQKIALLRAVTDSIYHARPDGAVVFDANRDWLHHVETLVRLYPLCRFVICLRNPASIVNSILMSKRVMPADPSLGPLVDAATGPESDLTKAIALLRDALSSNHAERMLILDYDRLTDDPDEALDVLYDFLREAPYHHDYQEIGGTTEGVNGPVIRSSGGAILPTRTVLQLSGRAFWRNLRRTDATMLLGRAR